MTTRGPTRARRGCGAELARWLLLLIVAVATLLAVWYVFIRPFSVPISDDARSVRAIEATRGSTVTRT